jgi:hypothetical protein
MIISSKPLSRKPAGGPPSKVCARSISPQKQLLKKPAALVKKPAETKKEAALKEPKKVLTVKDIALAALEKERDASTSGRCVIVFNHYKKDFEVKNGVLTFADVDEEYSFSFVYKGKYRRDLFLVGERVGQSLIMSKLPSSSQDEEVANRQYARRDDEGLYFIEMNPESIYKIELEESEAGIGAEGLRIRSGPYKAFISNSGVKSRNVAVNDLTQQLLKMDAKDLNNEEARKLREQRDIEDVLFSGN